MSRDPIAGGEPSPTDDLFRGTAWYYARYRPGYPPAFFDHVVARFGLDGTVRLLDLGCGTGQLTLPLAWHMAEVVGMDPEPEMLAEAAAAARTAGVGNVTWLEGGSDDLERLRPRLGRFRLVTMGASFHWMDREATLRQLEELVLPGGGLVVTGSPSLWTRANPWQRAVREVIQRWLGEQRRAGSGAYRDPPERHEVVLARSAFRRLEHYRLDYRAVRDIDWIVGNLYSTSFASPAVLGARRAGFERDLRATLEALSPDGQFEEEVALEAILAWKE